MEICEKGNDSLSNVCNHRSQDSRSKAVLQAITGDQSVNISRIKKMLRWAKSPGNDSREYVRQTACTSPEPGRSPPISLSALLVDAMVEKRRCVRAFSNNQYAMPALHAPW